VCGEREEERHRERERERERKEQRREIERVGRTAPGPPCRKRAVERVVVLFAP
jgi:hypothetical protein